MSKIKPVRCAAVVKTYVCASGNDTLPAGTVRALPGNINTTATCIALSSHTPFSFPSLLNHWTPDAQGIAGQLWNATAADGDAADNNGLLVQPDLMQAA